MAGDWGLHGEGMVCGKSINRVYSNDSLLRCMYMKAVTILVDLFCFVLRGRGRNRRWKKQEVVKIGDIYSHLLFVVQSGLIYF